MIEKIKKLIDRLSRKYKEESLYERLEQKYGNVKTDKRTVEIEVPDIQEKTAEVMFQDHLEYNQKKLQDILEDFSDMCQELEKVYPENERTANYYKCIRQFSNKINGILNKRQILEKGEEVAKKFKSGLEQTLVKVWNIGAGCSIIKNYLIKWGIAIAAYDKGKYLSDEEMEYLDLSTIQIYQKRTADKGKDGEVIEMIRPIFLISYLSEEEELPEYEYIAGQCRYYCYSA